MGIVKDIQETIELSEMTGRTVTVYLVDFHEIEGTLHSITSHGILVKEHEHGNYEIYPWWQVKCMVHETNIPQEKKEEKTDLEESIDTETKNDWEQLEDVELEIVESTSSILTENIPEDYEWEWYEDDIEAVVTNDDGDESILVHINNEEVTVQKEKDLDLAKTLAKKLKIKKLIKDYKE